MILGRRALPLALLALLLSSRLATGASPPPSQPEASTSRTVTCAFSNPGYSGWCRVTKDLPEKAPPRKVCQGVLRCLNDVECLRTYCEATTIRRGWRLESVKVDQKKN